MQHEFQPLITWYRRARRAMPWRLNPTPYTCWLSEIMLQQTTYEQALPYYERFLKRFPDVATLAASDEQDVLKAWEGLGYYARARNLLKAARRIAAEGWPSSAAAWREVPGIGPYTAAALASVLNGEKIPVVDGNVARVFARYWRLADDFKKQPPRERLAARLLGAWSGGSKIWSGGALAPAASPGDLNQAMMELGALVCTPKAPKCRECPLRKRCQAYAAGEPEAYPVRAAKKALPVRRSTAVIVTDGKGSVLLVRRQAGDLLKGLWELPTVADAGAYTQTFSHFKLELSLLRATAAAFVDPLKVPLTTAARKILAQSGLLSNATRPDVVK